MTTIVRGTISHDLDGGNFAVETPMGYSLLEWFGGEMFTTAGEVVEGELHSFGMKDILILKTGKTVRVWVDNFWADETEADAHCRDG